MGSISLRDTRVLVTGGAGGVGRAVAARLLDEGARLVLADRNADVLERLADELGDTERAIPVVADLSHAAGVDALFGAVDSRLGGLDILVACAGMGRIR